MNLSLATFFGLRAGRDGARAAANDVSLGDSAREAHDWPMAATHYENHLKTVPQDAAIWVQYGHALKEMGKKDRAEEAYRRGADLAPGSADTSLQLGHILKLRGRISSAVDAYRRALELDPSLHWARMELKALGEFDWADPADAVGDPRIVFDLSDVFAYLWHHDTVTGIQRVQLGIAEAFLERQDLDRELIFLANSPDNSAYLAVDSIFVKRLLRELAKPDVSLDALRKIVLSAADASPQYLPRPRDLTLILGAFWVIPNITQRVAALKARGVAVGVLIHDIIPLTHPEYCETKTVENFTECSPVVTLADFILTVSDHTGRELAAYLRKIQCPDIPITTLRLAHLTWGSTSGVDAPVSKAIARILSKPFALYVSTIEIRKNHIYLFRIWEQLLNEGREPPRLIFVGRPGWRIDDFMAKLEATRGLGGFIKIVHGLSDAELTLLYKGAQFTLFPSFEEGWGLPVGESLFFGRPCVASCRSSIPEVGGDLVDYVDPGDMNSGYRAVKRFIEDSEYLDSRARQIKTDFSARTWAQVADEMLAFLRETVFTPAFEPAGIKPPLLPGGRLHQLGFGSNKLRFLQSRVGAFGHFVFDANWRELEEFGRWTAGRRGTLRFRSAGASGACLVALEIKTVSWLGDNRLRVRINETNYDDLALDPGVTTCFVFETALEDEDIEIRLEVIGDIARDDGEKRPLSIGVRSLGCAARAQIDQRLSLLEDIVYRGTKVVTAQRLGEW